ncbi:glycosyltransferase family 2 protein [Verrucomicrobiota bacterium]
MLTIIIISYNSAGIINQCQKELLLSDRFQIVCVDNASPDGSGNKLRDQFPDVDVISLDKNIGYGRAANVGLRKADTPYALLLNPDLVTSPEDIQQLLEYAENDTSNTAIWGPASLKKDFTGEPPQSVKWVSGCAMLFDVEKIRKVGLFDENIFLFSEETDLCERTIAAGYEIKLCKDIYFDHLVGQASTPNPHVEYMKWWHFGWSQCYRMTKNGHCTWIRNPRRKLLTYRMHSFTSSSPEKRMKWKAKADGASAFIRGDKAFDEQGRPKMSDFSKQPQPRRA